jgi:hypothetical protein
MLIEKMIISSFFIRLSKVPWVQPGFASVRRTQSEICCPCTEACFEQRAVYAATSDKVAQSRPHIPFK